MSDLKATVEKDLAAAMKARDTERMGTLRMIVAAIRAEEVAGKTARALDDQEIIAVLAREVKKRGEAAEIYQANDRPELAAKERAEQVIIEEYLPAQLDDAALTALVDAALAQVRTETGEEPGMRQMGQVMKVATAAAAGGVDGKRLSTAVRARLAG